jgi:HEAT repeat protein
VSLAQIGDPQALGTGQFLMASPDLPIRKAAIQLVAKFPEAALETGKRQMHEPDEPTARTAVELLGVLGTPEALEAAAAALSDNRPGLRIQALLVLEGRCPPAHQAKMASLKDSRRSSPDCSTSACG